MLLVRDLLVSTKQRLAAAGCDSPQFEAEELLAYALDVTKGTLLAMRSFSLDEAALARLEAATLRRESREPMAYIIEETDFYGHRFRVRSGVLVPRTDSEVLVDACLAAMPESGTLLELGLGTGCISLSLLVARSTWQGVGVDLSPRALQVSAENAEILGVTVRMRCYEGSWYSALPADQSRFDLIVSNPPYIDPAERDELMPEVGQFEPALALFAEERGLAAYQSILGAALDWLNPDGVLALELGAGQAEVVCEIARKAGFSRLATTLDTQGHERVLVARK